MGRPKRRRTRERAIPRRRTGQTPGARGKAGSREAPGPERARRGERQNAEGERNHEGRKEAETHTEHGGGRKTRQKPPDVERPGAPAQHPATGTCRFGRDGGGGPAGLSDTQRAPSSARDLPQQHTPAVSIQAAPAANRLLACQGRRLPPPPQRAEPLDRAQGRVLFRGGAAGPWARAARASQDPKATAGMGPRRLPRAQARRMGRTPMKPARPPESCCGGTRAGATRARARPTHAKRQKAQRKDPPNGAHKCSVAPFLILIL